MSYTLASLLRAATFRAPADAPRGWAVLALLSCLIFVAPPAAQAAQTSTAGRAAEFVPLSLVEKAAAYYASQRWPGCRPASITPYFALDGGINAYAVQFTKRGAAPATEAELSAKVADREQKEAILDASRPGPPAEESPQAANLSAGGEIIVEGENDGRPDHRNVHAIVPPDVLAAAHKKRARTAQYRKALSAWRKKRLEAANAAVLADEVGTVIIAARYDLYPLLERFDGAAPHLKHASRAAKLAVKGGRGAKLQRSFYLGPLSVIHEIEAPGAGDKTKLVPVDTLRGRVLDRKKDLGRGAGRLPPAPAGRRTVSPQRVWEDIENAGAAAGQVSGDDVGPGARMIPGVPYYHQDDYGDNSCGPTASAQVLGYWDDHGYGNLVDNGSSTSGHVNELVFSLMRAEGFYPGLGTPTFNIEPGMEAVCNNSDYGNDLNFAVTYDASVSWTDDIKAEIDANRPFLYVNSDLDSYPYWSHVATGVGYDETSGHILYVHYNYPPDTPYELNWDNIPANNQVIYKVDPGGEPTFDCLWSEDFESGFPGPWTVGGDGGSDGYWAGTSYRFHNLPNAFDPPASSTSYSAYCVGSHVSPPGPYPNDTNGWMIYGPFSTVGRTGGEVSAYVWHSILDGGTNDDYVALLASIDGTNFWGEHWWGDNPSWDRRTLDLANVNTLGNLMGNPQVWVAVWFHSDAGEVGEGAYVDDVTIKLLGAQTLIVQSEPITGVSITGDKPGITNYTATCDNQQVVGLAAPANVTVADVAYDFTRWVVDGAQEPEGQTTVQVTMNAYRTAVALYKAQVPLLTVRSMPITGVSITGDKPGATNYATFCDDQEVIDLTAPATSSSGGAEYGFTRWLVDGAEMPEAQAAIQITMDADHTAVALYEMQSFVLTVRSIPLAGAGITGDKPGVTDYTAYCDDQEVINLTSPTNATIDHVDYTFIRWVVDGAPRPDGQAGLQITMDADLTAVAEYDGEWNIPGDVTGDCVVSILDLIGIRNNMLEPVGTGDNWRYDVTKDGVINILDMVLVRNHLYTVCAE